jgi:hypothetical protein
VTFSFARKTTTTGSTQQSTALYATYRQERNLKLGRGGGEFKEAYLSTKSLG